jgi:hypothetical protein
LSERFFHEFGYLLDKHGSLEQREQFETYGAKAVTGLPPQVEPLRVLVELLTRYQNNPSTLPKSAALAGLSEEDYVVMSKWCADHIAWRAEAKAKADAIAALQRAKQRV